MNCFVLVVWTTKTRRFSTFVISKKCIFPQGFCRDLLFFVIISYTRSIFFMLQQTLNMTTNLPAVSKARNTIHQTLKNGGKKFTKGCSLLVEKPIEKQYYHYYYNLYCFPLSMCPPSHKNSAKNKNIPIHWSNSSYLT